VQIIGGYRVMVMLRYMLVMEFSVYDNGLYRGQVTWQQADTTGHPASIGQYDVLLLSVVMVIVLV